MLSRRVTHAFGTCATQIRMRMRNTTNILTQNTNDIRCNTIKGHHETMLPAELFRTFGSLRYHLPPKLRHIRASEAVCSIIARSTRPNIQTSWVTLLSRSVRRQSTPLPLF